MKTELISVGTELLLGQIVNTNATFLSKELAELGFEVYFQTVVGDNPKRLEEVLQLADERSELIILCGGLGPTDDDLTKDAVANHVQEKLILYQPAVEKMTEYVKRSGRELTENNLRQALTIENGEVIENPNGLAVGYFYKKGTQHYILLAGPPWELEPMFHQCVKPILARISPSNGKLTSRVLRFFGIGESQLVTKLADIIEEQSNPTLAPYAKLNEVTLRLTAQTFQEDPEVLLDEMEATILQRVGEFFYGYGDDNSLEEETVKLLKTHKVTVTSAESLTAGLFQSTLGNVAGVSAVFPGGMVTYSSEIKNQLLGVSTETIEKYGVVSKECAAEMAVRVKEKFQTDYALSFTGVAGPESLEGQEVGTVWIGLADPTGNCQTFHYTFARERQTIRQMAVKNGLNILRKQVSKDFSK